MVLCKQDRRGSAILDGLRLCFIAEPSLFTQLSHILINKSIDIGQYTFHRTKAKHHSHVFAIHHLVDGERILWGHLKFGFHNGDSRFENLIWIWAHNRVLYSEPDLRQIYDLVSILNLTFNNFTSLDIAKDFKKSIVTVIRKLYKDTGNSTIINGKVIQDRKRFIPELRFDYSVSLDKLMYPTFCAKQHSAISDKTKGATVTAYNKLAEIENKSDKQYILDFYGNPPTLHRLEIHLNRAEIADYAASKGITPSLDWIFDMAILEDLFFHHLHSIIRFTRKRDRKPLDWRDILCNGGIR